MLLHDKYFNMNPASVLQLSLLLHVVSSSVLNYLSVTRQTASGGLFDSGYRINREKIGSGTFCTAFEGYHKDRINQTVVVRACRYESEFQRKQYIAECELHRTLDHEIILRLIDCFQGEGPFFVFVVEYMNMGDLQGYFGELNVGECFSKRIVQHLFQELLKGVEYLHSNKIIHRDLKHANILLDERAVKIGDFGNAERLDESESIFTGCINCGTPGFSAPEMATGLHTFSADVYSLGVILFELATCGLFPPKYSKFSKIRIMASLTEHRVNPDLIALIVGMTAQNPLERLSLQQVRESLYVLEDIPSI